MNFTSFSGSLNFDIQFIITVILTLGVILVNGWTDAPNAIASPVVTRALKPGVAVIMAAIMNFFGVLVTTSVNYEVVKTIYNIADFSASPQFARTALAASMTSIVLWAVAAWAFGIPTSESHALVAGITGASVALKGNFSGVSSYEWFKVIYGLLLSAVIGFVSGFVICKSVECVFKNKRRSKVNNMFDIFQIVASACTSFLHGAQDGQKFIGIFLLCFSLAGGNSVPQIEKVPFVLVVICSVTMALGTAMGGKKIIKSVGMDMASLQKYQGFSADAASALSLAVSTLLGLPVSTTHVKSTAVMGVGASYRLRSVNWSVAKDMVLAWVFTFPACFFLSYLVTKVYFIVFL